MSTLTTGTLREIRAVDQEFIEAIVQFASCEAESPSVVLFHRRYVSDDYVRLSVVYKVLATVPHWDSRTVTLLPPFRDPLKIDPTFPLPATAHWPHIHAHRDSDRLNDEIPTSWIIYEQHQDLRISVGTSFNLWDLEDLTFTLSAVTVGIRAIEHGWIEFVAVIVFARSDCQGCVFVRLTVPATNTHLPRRVCEAYRAHCTNLPRLPHSE